MLGEPFKGCPPPLVNLFSLIFIGYSSPATHFIYFQTHFYVVYITKL
jgi:hypothetical protein